MALGAYNGIELTWAAGGTPFITTAKNYASGRDITFSYRFPQVACSNASAIALPSHLFSFGTIAWGQKY